MNYPIRIASRTGFAAVGVRVTVPVMDELGPAVLEARRLLRHRVHEIGLVRDAHTVYGISPPNYKGNPGPFDFYVCVEVERLERLPHGMVLLRLQPKLYAEVEYRGPLAEGYRAYDFTSRWLRENGYEYDDTEYYYEVYDERNNRLDYTDENGEMKVFSPVKPMAGFKDSVETAPIVHRIGYMYLPTNNIDASIRWYTEKLGFTLRNRFEDGDGAKKKDGSGSTIAVLHLPGKLAAPLLLIETDDRKPAHHLKNGHSFPVAALNCADLENLHRKLQEDGTETSEITELGRGEARYFTFRDPDGNLLEAAWSIWDPEEDRKTK